MKLLRTHVPNEGTCKPWPCMAADRHLIDLLFCQLLDVADLQMAFFINKCPPRHSACMTLLVCKVECMQHQEVQTDGRDARAWIWMHVPAADIRYQVS